MENLSKTTQSADYYRVMQKRIQYYSKKYDPYQQYISAAEQQLEDLPVKETRVRRSSLIQAFFLNIF